MPSDATAAPKTLITQEMRDKLNVWSEPRISPPVDLSDIRKWAIAVYWPDTPPRIFWDKAYARTTRWGGVIAPREFNPFAWPVERPADLAPKKVRRGPGEHSMNAGQTETYGVPIRIGDVISARTALVKLEECVGKLGLTLFRYTEFRWTNQRGEFVKSRVGISILY